MRAVKNSGSRFETLDDFVRIVSADPVALGFKPAVTRLSKEQWVVLHRTLTGAAL